MCIQYSFVAILKQIYLLTSSAFALLEHAVTRPVWRKACRWRWAATRCCRWTARSWSWAWRRCSASGITRGTRRRRRCRNETEPRRRLSGCKTAEWRRRFSDSGANANPGSHSDTASQLPIWPRLPCGLINPSAQHSAPGGRLVELQKFLDWC